MKMIIVRREEWVVMHDLVDEMFLNDILIHTACFPKSDVITE